MRRLLVLVTPLLLTGCGGHADGSTGTTSVHDSGGAPDPTIEEPTSSAPVGDPVAVTAPEPTVPDRANDHDASVSVSEPDASVSEPDVSVPEPDAAPGSQCNCAPGDLMCAMRCAAGSKDPPVDSGHRISDGGTPSRDAAPLCNCAPSDLMCAMRCAANRDR